MKPEEGQARLLQLREIERDGRWRTIHRRSDAAGRQTSRVAPQQRTHDLKTLLYPHGAQSS